MCINYLKYFVGGLDFHNENYFYSFKDENDTYKLILNSIDDNLVEPDETYYLNVMLTGGKYHGIRIAREYQTAVVTIIDDDGKRCSYCKITKKTRAMIIMLH